MRKDKSLSMDVRIRELDRDDAAELSALANTTYAAAFGHTFTPGDLRAHLDRHLSEAAFRLALDADIVLAAVAGNKLVGFIQFGDLKSDATAADAAQELRRLYVLADYQRRGIGRLLMEAALAHQRLAGAKKIYLDVWEHNGGAQALYRQYGFEVADEKRFVFASGTEGGIDLVMVRNSRELPIFPA